MTLIDLSAICRIDCDERVSASRDAHGVIDTLLGEIHRSQLDVVCFSHLRWDFVYQRPQHLMSRFARRHRVFFFEEPIARPVLKLDCTPRLPNVRVLVAHLPPDLTHKEQEDTYRSLVTRFVGENKIRRFVLWYTTPMPYAVTSHLHPAAVIYDCMDELSAFKDAPITIEIRERELLRTADVVFAGGRSLFRAKRRLHSRVMCFPSSVDASHFLPARQHLSAEPADQASIPRPRLGFAGVIDERTDLGLLDALAAARPDWQIIMLGPVVKIDASVLPRRANIHYLGFKPYQELPGYLAGWDIGLLPFAHNASTRFISPTKTLEYLAAGLPIVSTTIPDITATFGRSGLVAFADNVGDTISRVESMIAADSAERCARIDRYLAQTSWERTWRKMVRHVHQAISLRAQRDVLATTTGPASER